MVLLFVIVLLSDVENQVISLEKPIGVINQSSSCILKSGNCFQIKPIGMTNKFGTPSDPYYSSLIRMYLPLKCV
jgi:hypothetical protein